MKRLSVLLLTLLLLLVPSMLPIASAQNDEVDYGLHPEDGHYAGDGGRSLRTTSIFDAVKRANSFEFYELSFRSSFNYRYSARLILERNTERAYLIYTNRCTSALEYTRFIKRFSGDDYIKFINFIDSELFKAYDEPSHFSIDGDTLYLTVFQDGFHRALECVCPSDEDAPTLIAFSRMLFSPFYGMGTDIDDQVIYYACRGEVQ